MPRTPRKELAGGIHHVYNRGNRGDVVFIDDADRAFFLAELGLCSRRYRWGVLAYCLMPNHLHLVIETPETTLGDGMRWLAGNYAQEFNRRHHPKGGHVFRGRFGSKIAESDDYFAQLLLYVALNPVAAGLCATPEEWPWSSHRDMIAIRPGAAGAHERVESLLAGWGGEEGSRYAALFDTEPVLVPPFHGPLPWDERPPLDELLGASPTKDEMLAARGHGYTLAEIAAALEVHPSTVSRRLRSA
jgi:REP element-mobilizing transposase RayT